MSKIIVREYDNTKAGTSQYSNFSVLVIGAAKPDNLASLSRDDVYEFASQKDFKDTIGCVPPSELGLPTPVPCEPGNSFKIIADGEEPEEGQKTWSEVAASINDIYIAGDEGQEPGRLVDESGQAYVSAELETFEDVDPACDYFLIPESAAGRSADTHLWSYGNLMAYTLLGLGYTVLYKLLPEDTEDIFNDSYWEELTDKSNYDFRYVTHGLLDENDASSKSALDSANAAIVTLAHFVNNFDANDPDATTGRGDCTALCEIPNNCYENNQQTEAISNIKAYVNGAAKASKYAGYFGPFVVYDINIKQAPWNEYWKKDTEDNIGKFPAVFHYLACAAKAAENYREWYAVAGYARGVSDFTIKYTGCDFGERAQNILQPRCKRLTNGLKFAVNLITKIKGNYYLWGNRTAHELGLENTDEGDLKASHFLNIRQLCTTIKKQIYVTCRKYTFDPNSEILWVKFCNDIRPTLESMKSGEGIEDYKFVRVKTDKKALLKAKVRIVPTYAVEDFDISLTLEDSVSGIVAGVDEE